MNFEIIDTNIDALKIIKYKKFADDRGYFSELYKSNDFKELGLDDFVQDNISCSAAGVIRGMHWQDEPFGQGKLVSCVRGRIKDIAVDIRSDSKTYGKHVEVELSEMDGRLFWIPVGFAHGFQALEDNTLVMYKVTNYWNKDHERSVNPLDPSLQINWEDLVPIISQKDNEAPDFDSLA